MTPGRDAARLTRFEQRVAGPRQVLALVWLPVWLGSRIDSPPPINTLLDLASTVIWLFFLAEYLRRVQLAPEPCDYVRSHRFDVAALLFPPLRALWGLTSFRAVLSRPGLGVFLALMLGVVAAAAGAVFAIERDVAGANIDTLGDAVWWATVTVTTVGYGDRTPVSGLGRSVAGGLILVGVVLYSVVTAHITAYVFERSRLDRSAMPGRLDARGFEAQQADDMTSELTERLKAIESALRSIERSLNGLIASDRAEP